MSELALVRPSGPLHRIARADAPLDFSRIDAADAQLADAGNRFDVPGAGVLYLASDAITCYYETLGRFRPSAALIAALGEEDPGLLPAGTITQEWRARRLHVTTELIGALPFIDIESPRTHVALTTELAPILDRLGIGHLDIGQVRGPNRLLTRAIAAWAYAALDKRGARFGGIRYRSKMNGGECWAVFEGTEIRELTRHSIEPTNADLAHVATEWSLQIG